MYAHISSAKLCSSLAAASQYRLRVNRCTFIVHAVFFYIEYTALVHEQPAKLFVLEKKLADTVLTGLFVVFSGNHLASFMKGTHTNERNVELSIKAVVLF